MLNVDTAQIQAKGGNGGNGCIAFRREKFVPHGGPNGGDGGKGGDVILESIEGMTTLIDLKYQQHQRADNGQHGMGKLRNGKDANDRIIKVPVGTIVRWVEAEDLENWSATEENPVTYNYKNYTVCKTDFWGQGPSLLQQLAILKNFDLENSLPTGTILLIPVRTVSCENISGASKKSSEYSKD